LIDQEKIHNQCISNNREERIQALKQFKNFFPSMPDKQQAWNDLHRLTNDEDSFVRYAAASTLGSAFSQVPDKQQAWKNLVEPMYDENSGVESNAAMALGLIFSHVPDKQQAWDDLYRLTQDEEIIVRLRASFNLGSVFSHVPDKQRAWDDLHRLTYDEDNYVRSGATFSIGSVFSQLPDKQQALSDLYRLTKDQYRSVRTFANNSLGKVSIYKASKAENEEDYKKELENAIEYFEESINISYDKWYCQPKFCLLFYRSFHTIIFKRLEAKEEVERYLEEVKSEIEGSKSKELLFEAVIYLAEALNEVQKLENLDLETIKGELNFYRKYCDHAAELMKDTDERAPFATEVLRKGLPILDRNLKGILEEIQEKAKTACQVSQGTATQKIACAINREVQKWEIGSQEEMTFNLENLIFTLVPAAE
jgi:HEAT repeat protein